MLKWIHFKPILPGTMLKWIPIGARGAASTLLQRLIKEVVAQSDDFLP